MARKKISSDDELFAELARDTGGDLLSDRDKVRYYLDTGSLAVNYIMSGKFYNGGLAGTRIIEVYGPSSSGKSYIAANAIFGCQKMNGICAILDCENATDGEFMQKTSHLELKKVIRYTPQSLEAGFRKIHTGIKRIRTKVPDLNRPIFFVWDSISVPPCDRELRENNLPENYKASDWKKLVGRKEQPGERAKVCSAEFRKLQGVLEKTNTTLLVINQTREKIGVLYGCFSGRSKVLLADGSWMRIAKIVNQKMPVEVLSVDPSTGVLSPKKVVGWHKNGKVGDNGDNFFTVKFRRFAHQYGYMNVTSNHILFVPDGTDGIKETTVSRLKVGDKLAVVFPERLGYDQWQLAYGSILGDGSDFTPKHETTRWKWEESEVLRISKFDHTHFIGDDEKYDLSVESNHSYIVGGAIVHNSPETTGGGGKSLPFYAAQRFRTSTKKKIENKRLGSFAGVNMKVANVKNRLFRPFVESEGIQLYFDSGINPISGLLSLLIQAERITGNKGVYSVTEDYLPEGETEYKFKASKERNDVPLKALLDCPGLVDASSRAELEEYLAPFMNAIGSSSSEDFKEKAIAFDEDGNLLDTEDDDVAAEVLEIEEDEGEENES